MTGALFTTLVSCYMTPGDLRQIADKMEDKWKSAWYDGSPDKLGDNLTIHTWIGDDCEVRIVIDQERIAKEFPK